LDSACATTQLSLKAEKRKGAAVFEQLDPQSTDEGLAIVVDASAVQDGGAAGGLENVR
jgi:hypothetical protein